MKFLIDEDVIFSFSPQRIEEIKDNLRKIFFEIHKIKGWKWSINKKNLAVGIGITSSVQSYSTKESIWISLIWAASSGSIISPDSYRQIFISKYSMNKSPSSQNVHTYHSYSDLLQKYTSGNLKLIIR
jgi:hypothetical protein